MSTKNTKSVKTEKTEVIMKGEDITAYVLPRLAKTYASSVKKVLKEGRDYTVIFHDGYTAFEQTSRKCKDIPGIMWYSKIAYQEKNKGYDKTEWTKWLNDHKIVWDGKNIPEFIWTADQYKKYNVEIPVFSK